MSSDIDLLAFDIGLVTAPAGCGKTQLVANALKKSIASKPVLVLTHTNAGVVALRNRLDRENVPHKSYRLCTLDGWAMRLVSTFPLRSNCSPQVLQLVQPSSDYPAIRVSAVNLLKSGDISEILDASYSRIVVDEYQDCSIRQHALIFYASKVLPVVVLGDPLQAIFGFGSDPLAQWDKHVQKHFPMIGELDIPWRWKNAGSHELGEWLLFVRKQLLNKESIDLLTAPKNVQWIELKESTEFNQRLAAAQIANEYREQAALIIASSIDPQSHRTLASRTPGSVVVEAVDLKDLVAFAKNFNLTSPDSLTMLANFAQNIMTNVGADNLVTRVGSLRSGRAKKKASEVELVAIKFLDSPSFLSALELLVEIQKEAGVRLHRPILFRACTDSLRLCISRPDISFYQAALQARERNRLLGRPLPRRAVGSTLLLKGLEADIAVVLTADMMDAQNLYVAMTRGSKQLKICSRSSKLKPG